MMEDGPLYRFRHAHILVTDCKSVTLGVVRVFSPCPFVAYKNLRTLSSIQDIDAPDDSAVDMLSDNLVGLLAQDRHMLDPILNVDFRFQLFVPRVQASNEVEDVLVTAITTNAHKRS